MVLKLLLLVLILVSDMGIFDIIELKQHCRAIGEYLLYMDAHPEDKTPVTGYCRDHLKKMYEVLGKYDKND